MNYKINFSFNKYLYKCENINKYNLKTSYNSSLPTKIKLSLQIALSELKEYKETEVYIKTIFLMFIITYSFSLIRFNFQENFFKKNKLKEKSNIILLKNNLTQKNKIYYFLIKLFFNLLKTKILFHVIKSSSFVISSLYVPITYFDEISLLQKDKNFNMFLQETNILIEIYVKKTKNLNFNLKNLPFFWISG